MCVYAWLIMVCVWGGVCVFLLTALFANKLHLVFMILDTNLVFLF